MKITYKQYVQLIGLKALAERHNNALEDIIASVQEIVQERDASGRLESGGHVSDFVYSNNLSIEDLLKRLEITVDEAVG